MTHSDHTEQALRELAGQIAASIGGEWDATAETRLTAYAQLKEALNAATRLEVEAARSMGTTWEIIGTSLGMSKQAAHERFS